MLCCTWGTGILGRYIIRDDFCLSGGQKFILLFYVFSINKQLVLAIWTDYCDHISALYT